MVLFYTFVQEHSMQWLDWVCWSYYDSIFNLRRTCCDMKSSPKTSGLHEPFQWPRNDSSYVKRALKTSRVWGDHSPLGPLLVCEKGGMCVCVCVNGVGNPWKTWRLPQLTWVVWNLCVSHVCHRRLRTSKWRLLWVCIKYTRRLRKQKHDSQPGE